MNAAALPRWTWMSRTMSDLTSALVVGAIIFFLECDRRGEKIRGGEGDETR